MFTKKISQEIHEIDIIKLDSSYYVISYLQANFLIFLPKLYTNNVLQQFFFLFDFFSDFFLFTLFLVEFKKMKTIMKKKAVKMMFINFMQEIDHLCLLHVVY